MGTEAAGGVGAPQQPVLLLLHHLQPPLEWQRAATVLRSSLCPAAAGGPQEEEGPPYDWQGAPLTAAKLQQLLRDIQHAIHQGYIERQSLLQQGDLTPPGLGVALGAPSGQAAANQQQQQQVLPPPPRLTPKAYSNVERLFAAVPAAATQPFFSRALPLLIKAVLAAEQIFPRCTYTPEKRTHSEQVQPDTGDFRDSPAAAAAAAATATGAAAGEAEGRRLNPCQCGSCRLRLQLYKHCSSDGCSSRSSSIGGQQHVSSSAAELSAGEVWVLFGLGFLGLLPPPEWQQVAAGFPNLGDISFADFYDLTGTLPLLLLLLLLLL